MTGALPPSVNLTRIEAVHRGFLFQHLYGVACLLSFEVARLSRLTIEAAEDLELERDDGVFRIQVKHHQRPLSPADIADSIARVKASIAADPQRAIRLVFVSTSAPTRTLGEELKAEAAYVDYFHPGADGTDALGIPPCFAGIQEALAWCEQRASELPFLRVAPRNLVLKLATEVLHAAAGERFGGRHDFVREELADLFDQSLVRLSRLPPAVPNHRVFERDLSLSTSAPVRIVWGHSGAGKTSWVAEEAAVLDDDVVYVDARTAANHTIAALVGQEVAAVRLGSDPDVFRRLCDPQRQPMDVLSAVVDGISDLTKVLIIIDNAQELPSEVSAELVRRGGRLRWVFLGQPGPQLKELRGRVDASFEELPAWGASSIAEEFLGREMPISPVVADRIRAMTGGLPLNVRGLAALAESDYGRDAAKCVLEVLNGEAFDTTIQDFIVSKAVARLSDKARMVLATLSLIESYLTKHEIESLEIPDAAAGIRELRTAGVIVPSVDRFAVHDAFRSAVRALRLLTKEQETDSLRSILDRLRPSPERKLDGSRLRDYLLLLHQVDPDGYADYCGRASELLYEVGLEGLAEQLLRPIVDDLPVAESKVFALEALAYWALQRGDERTGEELVGRLYKMRDASGLSRHARCAIALKRMSIGSTTVKELMTVHRFAEANAETAGEKRTVRYTMASALYSRGRHSEAEVLYNDLVLDYARDLGIGLPTLANSRKLRIPEGASLDDLQRFGDCIDALARGGTLADATGTPRAKGAASDVYARQPTIGFMHAMQAYGAAGAATSQLKAGHALVDHLALLGKWSLARSILEKLVPVAEGIHPNEAIVVRAILADVLVREGDTVEASAVWSKVAPYVEGLEEPVRSTIEVHRGLVEAAIKSRNR